MNILLLGHKGYLGSYLHKHLQADILETPKRKIYPNGKSYQYVINCISKPDLEYCEIHTEETEYSNYLVIKDIKEYYQQAKIINFSSYYVYDDDGLCTEESQTTTAYNYCRQKLLGEKEVTNGVSFRLGKLFGNIQSTQNKLTEHIIANNNLTLDSILFNPISVQQVLSIVKYELENRNLSGIYNLANQGVVSHYDYGVFIGNYLGIHKDINKVEKLNRKFHNYGKFTMSVEKLNRIIPLTPWQEDIEMYLQGLLNSKKNTDIL